MDYLSNVTGYNQPMSAWDVGAVYGPVYIEVWVVTVMCTDDKQMFWNETADIRPPSWVYDEFALDNVTQTVWEFTVEIYNIVWAYIFEPQIVGKLRGGVMIIYYVKYRCRCAVGRDDTTDERSDSVQTR